MSKKIDLDSISRRYNKPEESPGYLLLVVSNMWQKNLRDSLTDLGITPDQFVLLAHLARLTSDGDPISQMDLAHYVMMDKTMVSELLGTLERKGLIIRMRHPYDKRANSLVVTDNGITIVEDALERVDSANNRFFSAIGDDVNSLVEILRKFL